METNKISIVRILVTVGAIYVLFILTYMALLLTQLANNGLIITIPAAPQTESAPAHPPGMVPL
jgi:hypothetical protein